VALLSKEVILHALEELAMELANLGERAELIVGGGAALVMLYEAREATKDVDLFFSAQVEPSILRHAVKSVGLRCQLPEDWLNDGAKGYLHGLLEGSVLLDRPALRVSTLAPAQLLAMKLSAWRDDIDIEDARLLLSRVEGNREAVWSVVEKYIVPGRELKARYAFDDLWEAEHGA
jgi:hypothetical protein